MKTSIPELFGLPRTSADSAVSCSPTFSTLRAIDITQASFSITARTSAITFTIFTSRHNKSPLNDFCWLLR
jgi:hypothetical protein